MKVALVHDYLNQYGGAERVLECLAEMFPDAPIYTLFYDRELLEGRFADKTIHTSFIDNKFVRRKHRLFIPILPLAANSINLGNEYDLIISDSAGFAKGARYTRGFHISYIHSPLRYAWEPENYLKTLLPNWLIKAASPVFSYLKKWDYKTAQKPDVLLANSTYTARKISKFYKRASEVLNPGVDTRLFFRDAKDNRAGEKKYFLSYGRVLHYKKFDLIVQAFNKLDENLVIVGNGPYLDKLRGLITSPKIEILSSIRSDAELRKIISNAEALIFPQVEDFGLVALESIACGTPIIAYREGGALDIVKDGENGILFSEQTEKGLMNGIGYFKNSKFNREDIAKKAAEKFGKENFKRRFMEIVSKHLPK